MFSIKKYLKDKSIKKVEAALKTFDFKKVLSLHDSRYNHYIYKDLLCANYDGEKHSRAFITWLCNHDVRFLFDMTSNLDKSNDFMYIIDLLFTLDYKKYSWLLGYDTAHRMSTVDFFNLIKKHDIIGDKLNMIHYTISSGKLTDELLFAYANSLHLYIDNDNYKECMSSFKITNISDLSSVYNYFKGNSKYILKLFTRQNIIDILEYGINVPYTDALKDLYNPMYKVLFLDNIIKWSVGCKDMLDCINTIDYTITGEYSFIMDVITCKSSNLLVKVLDMTEMPIDMKQELMTLKAKKDCKI